MPKKKLPPMAPPAKDKKARNKSKSKAKAPGGNPFANGMRSSKSLPPMLGF